MLRRLSLIDRCAHSNPFDIRRNHSLIQLFTRPRLLLEMFHIIPYTQASWCLGFATGRTKHAVHLIVRHHPKRDMMHVSTAHFPRTQIWQKLSSAYSSIPMGCSPVCWAFYNACDLDKVYSTTHRGTCKATPPRLDSCRYEPVVTA